MAVHPGDRGTEPGLQAVWQDFTGLRAERGQFVAADAIQGIEVLLRDMPQHIRGGLLVAMAQDVADAGDFPPRKCPASPAGCGG